MQEAATKTAGAMEAGADDPLVGVYVVSQFVFCPRAGIIAYENRQEHEEKPASVNLDFGPIYDLRKLHELLAGNLKALTCQALALLGIVAVVFYLTHRVHPNLVVVGIAVVPLLFGPVCQTLCHTAALVHSILAHHQAIAKEPDPASDQSQPVQWCQMLKAGFISVPYKDRLRNDSWKLEGNPWRVLRRGNLRIPVFFQSANDKQLHAKHLAKAAAYCFLLQTVEVGDSPYALVLKEGSFEGVTVPYHPRTRKVFHDGLRLTRETIRSLKAGKVPAPPEQAARCSGCPLGKPVAFEPGESEHHAQGIPLQVFAITDDGKHIGHSHCGDRFRWIPQHAQAVERNIRPA